MSSLDKLGIRGIRSFDNNELSVIQFFHPLTVIVGHNGSGKTTIIECLKYITTGDMPPNTKGGAFVHDPNMAGETEVKAEVKLRFINTNGDKMTANRRLQVTKKKTTLSLKTLEGTIAYTGEEDDKTKRRALSSRCSDLDEEIPRLLGVSKAILENVIFCHQEESNWPLSEPGVLKKKFDDIFEATKYTKALDQIKSIRKEQAAEVKVDRERLLAFKTDRERAMKIEATVSKLEKDIISKGAQAEQLDEVIKEVTIHNKRFYELAVEHDRILNEVDNLQVKKEERENSINTLKNRITELPGTKQELQERRDNFAKETEEKRLKKKGYERDLEDADEEYTQTRKKVDRATTERGILQGEQQRMEQALDDRQSTVTSLALQHDIKGYDIDNLEEAKIDEFEHRLSGDMQKRKREYDDLKESGTKENDVKRSAISNMESEQNTNSAIKKDLKRQVERAEGRIFDLGEKINNARSSESEVLNLKQSIQDSEKRRQAIVDEGKDTNLDAQLRDKNRAIKEAEGQRDQLHAELSGLTRQADTRAKLAIKRADIVKGETSVQNMIESNAATYRQHLGQEPEKDKMLENVKDQIFRITSEVSRAEKAASAAQRDLNQVENSMSLIKSQKTKALKDAETMEKRVAEETEDHDLQEAISDAESEIKAREISIEQLRSAEKFFDRVLQHGRDKEVCLACSRGLTQAELPTFEAYCKKQVASTPAKIKQEMEDLPQWQTILTGLKKVEPDAAAAKKLRETDIPKLEDDLQRVEGRHQNATTKAEEASTRLTELKTQLRELESLKLVAIDVHRVLSEVKDTTREVQELERRLESSGSARTADDVQVELGKVGEQISALKKELEQLIRERDDRQERLHSCDSDISRTQLKLKDAERNASVRLQAQTAKAEVEKEKGDLQERLEGIDKKIKECEPALMRLKRELRDAQEKQREKETQAQTSSEALQTAHSQLKRAMDEVKRCKRADTKTKLRNCDTKIRDLDAIMKEQQSKMSELRSAVSAIEREENNSSNLHRNVEDNIMYRQLKEEVRVIERDIAGKDLEGANKAKRQFDKDYNVSRQKLQDLQAQHAKVGGELAMSQSTVAERKEELESEYKDIRKHYTRQLIKVKTADFAIQDLEKYGKALDNAIMKYHSHKMMEINDTAQALWNKCYQGTDIDTIMIKSDSEGAVKVGNRSYNYRVVMVKDQVELDMRGRCSAGQKVLASIIIRLALAESFGTNCGILALDEPTTNLDRDNIGALASALADIIKERRAQSNFQLIVITHDEEFLTALGASGALEKYWRVSRNHKQKSTIERQRLDQH